MYTEFYKALAMHGIAEAVKVASESGFDSVEMLDIRGAGWTSPLSVREARSLLEDKGLSVSCYSLAIDVIPFDKYGNIVGDCDSAVETAKRSAETASNMGSPYFHHTLVTNLRPDLHRPKPPYDAVFETLVKAASEIAKACNDMGLTVLYEPQGFYVNGSENFGRFYCEMKRLGYDVGVCGDMANTLFVDEPPIEFYRNFAKDFRHVHLKDYKCFGKEIAPDRKCLLSMDGRVYSETELGEGSVCFRECMKLLRSVGYDGAFSLEINQSGVDIAEESRSIIKTVRDNY
jgi:sugar phosphate isomerase/epimerase